MRKDYGKNKTRLCYLLLPMLLALAFVSCQKFLDKKPDQKLAVPSTLDDLEALLKDYGTLNVRYPVIGEIASDNYYVTDATFGNLNERERNFYSWQKFDDIGGDWLAPYRNIFNANVILESLNDIPISSMSRADKIKGSALFLRAFHHYALAQVFCVPYNETTAAEDQGIPLRLQTDLSIEPTRSSVAETYESIIRDLKTAAELLPFESGAKYLPGKAAAYGLLARVYLSMREYENAGLFADSSLQLYHVLLDYNTIDANAFAPFPQFNDEVIYDAKTLVAIVLLQSRAKVDTTLYAMYDTNDLRKTAFFREYADGSHAFKGFYTGSTSPSLFTGIATDELYLIRAESEARSGKIAPALEDINRLLVNRYKSGSFVPLNITDEQELTDTILAERRKELLYRTLRWTDLRRLNMEADHAQTIYRYLNGKLLSLPPNSPRYTFEIDRNSVNQSGLQQNP